MIKWVNKVNGSNYQLIEDGDLESKMVGRGCPKSKDCSKELRDLDDNSADCPKCLPGTKKRGHAGAHKVTHAGGAQKLTQQPANEMVTTPGCNQSKYTCVIPWEHLPPTLAALKPVEKKGLRDSNAKALTFNFAGSQTAREIVLDAVVRPSHINPALSASSRLRSVHTRAGHTPQRQTTHIHTLAGDRLHL